MSEFIINGIMDTIIAIIFGVVQGVTEFLPISSSGHLIIFHTWFKLPIASGIGFDVALHFASFLAVLYYFRKDVKQIFISWLKSFTGKIDQESRLAWLIVLATVPAVVVGFFLGDWIEARLRSNYIVAIALLIGGILFLLVERFGKFKKDTKSFGWREALLIGLAQVLAFIPGTSRSGITIIAALALGFKRPAAVRFSFLLALPVLLGAAFSQILPMLKSGIGLYELYLIVVAAWAALLASWWAVNYLLEFVKRATFKPFAYYRFLLAALLWLTLILF